MADFIALVREQILPVLLRRDFRFAPGDESTLSQDDAPSLIDAYPLDAHSHFEWFWVLSGEAQMRIEENVHTLSPGDICLLAPGARHTDVYSAHTPAYSSLWFSLAGDTIGTHLFAYEPVGQWNALRYDRVLCSPQIGHILLELQDEVSAARTHRDQAVRGLLLRITSWTLRALEEHPVSSTQKALPGTVSRGVMNYLETHYAEDVTLRDVAHAVCFSRTYLASLFKQETGQTIFEALTEIRMRHACRLLLEGTLPVHAVGAAVGFHDAHHFSRAFAKHTGMPPSRYGK